MPAIWLALFSIHVVISLLAGPPEGGLYFIPPSWGGLWEGVITMPSAGAELFFLLCSRIIKEITGVGVYSSPLCIKTLILLATRTSSEVLKAGSERACVSNPRYKGPLILLADLYSQMAWIIAAICSSLNVPFREEPLWPDVPNKTGFLISWV